MGGEYFSRRFVHNGESLDVLMHDPSFFGFCFGMKFISLQQLRRFKHTRRVDDLSPNPHSRDPGPRKWAKDDKDIPLMDKLLQGEFNRRCLLGPKKDHIKRDPTTTMLQHCIPEAV